MALGVVQAVGMETADLVMPPFQPLLTFVLLTFCRRAHTSAPQQMQHGLKRNAGERSGANLAGSPPKKENQLHLAKQRRGNKASSQGAASGRRPAYHSDSEVSSASSARAAAEPAKSAPSPAHGQRKHTRTADSPAVSGQGRRSPSPPHKREHHLADVACSPPRFGAAGGAHALLHAFYLQLCAMAMLPGPYGPW